MKGKLQVYFEIEFNYFLKVIVDQCVISCTTQR